MDRKIILILVFTIIAFGCIEEIPQVGCCMREQGSDVPSVCKLYYPLNAVNGIDPNGGELPIVGTCDPQTGCNATYDDGITRLTPICSQDFENPCTNPNCTAMVCGAFIFNPTPAPGYANPAEDAEGDPPAESASAIMNFYKANCRFIPFDEKFGKIIKSSKGVVNVFRMGAGASFDEFDQYRYLLPVSDKYCALTMTMTGDTKVDRYMNYINPTTLQDFDNPADDITENCVMDSDPPEPVSYDESTITIPGWTSSIDNTLPGTVVADSANYKFARNLRHGFFADWSGYYEGYYYDDAEYLRLFKKIDEGFYKRQLTIAHAESIYGLVPGEGRAPFECRLDKTECYSGKCDNTVYNRGVMIQEVGDTEIEIVTDCVAAKDENDQEKVFCYPTMDVTLNGNNPPTFDYAEVAVRYGYFEVNGSMNAVVGDHILDDVDYSDIDDAWKEKLWGWWGNFSLTFHDAFNDMDDDVRRYSYYPYEYMINSPSSIEFPRIYWWDYWGYDSYWDCRDDYSADTCSRELWDPDITESATGPPIGGAVFFGSMDAGTVQFRGNEIIGYALSIPGDFEDMFIVDHCGVNVTSGVETDDFIRISLDDIDDSEWQELMDAFKPYFTERINALKAKAATDCNEEVIPADVILTSIPWIVYYEQLFMGSGNWEDGGDGDWLYYSSSTKKLLSSSAAQAFRKRNIFNEPMVTTRGTDACTLEQIEYEYLDRAYDYYSYGPSMYGGRPAYYVAFSNYVYLFKHNGTTFGSACKLDDEFKPVVRELGWCEPCTTSTLAYQKIYNYDNVYLPTVTHELDVDPTSQMITERICEIEADYNFWHTTMDEYATCYNEDIPDMSDYNGYSPGIMGAPRTIPDASIMKERLGDYMKAGIMPVLEMSDANIWDLTNPQHHDVSGWSDFWGTDSSPPSQYSKYDFEPLIGGMGAAVVIIYEVDGSSTYSTSALAAKAVAIDERAVIMKDKCYGCLVAFHVSDPNSVTNFRDIIDGILGNDPSLSTRIDLVTFDYTVPNKNSEQIIDEISSYAQTALNATRINKPTMLVGLSAPNNAYWNDNNYEELLKAIANKQGTFVKSGLMGIIFSPVRGSGSSAFVTTSASGADGLVVGTKDEKFCALQTAFQLMSSTPPSAVLERKFAEASVNCTLCTGLDVAQGLCGTDECDDGSHCNLPAADPTASEVSPYFNPNIVNFRCPPGGVTIAGCNECNQTSGTYECTRTFQNGSTDTIAGDMDDIDSDLYMDVMAGFGKPDKCCLEIEDAITGTSTKYTYVRTPLQTPLNKPLVFSKLGYIDADCGFGSIADELGDTTEFCGRSIMPLRNYDINCTIIP
ncbi:MAG: hypothetical protein ABH842_04740 [Candidatus Micrarchaeota archaeon]